ncbi:hypothetical protein QWI17_11040 [Gilvimarinus sp. SDUM040013]|uniref:Lipoprotein n=1 Tax=Gilvimarinus gilvus TaxID=3058038 RepID=A0ABU4S302_9GAMM|nr:hypothetical protein [Gilvimarinus sp. SDUM040013]MDO3386373.1 hypothetical protein [Gilvimarinus sp. SDUM040013]MDX6849639.1 hypothetical protein [Gilvimarinus sp. SDUM040013]
MSIILKFPIILTILIAGCARVEPFDQFSSDGLAREFHAVIEKTSRGKSISSARTGNLRPWQRHNVNQLDEQGLESFVFSNNCGFGRFNASIVSHDKGADVSSFDGWLYFSLGEWCDHKTYDGHDKYYTKLIEWNGYWFLDEVYPLPNTSNNLRFIAPYPYASRYDRDDLISATKACVPEGAFDNYEIEYLRHFEVVELTASEICFTKIIKLSTLNEKL